MPLIKVPGVGTVNVPEGHEEQFREFLLKNQPEVKLSAQFDKIAREIRSGILEVTQENRQDIKDLISEVKNIKPEVTVESPQVHVEPPQVNVDNPPAVFEPKIEPHVEVITETKKAKKIRISNIERNASFRITGCDLDVVEWAK